MDNQEQTPEQQAAEDELLKTLREVVKDRSTVNGTERMQAALLIARIEGALIRTQLAELTKVVNGSEPQK